MDSYSNSEAVAASNGNVTGATDPSESLSSPTATTITTKTTTAPGTITATTNQTNHTNPTSTTSTITTTSSPSDNKHSIILHAHRQSHNSSKLPAFRFADLKKDPIAIPSLLQSHQIPPSPVSPISDPHAGAQPNTSREISPQPHQSQHKNNSDNNSPVSQEQLRTENLSPRSRASTFQSPRVLSTATSTSSANAKRSTSLGSTTASASAIGNTGNTNKPTPIRTSVTSPQDSSDTIATARPRHRRAPLSGNSASEASSGHRMHASDDSRGASSGEEISRELAHGQRELLLPKTIQRTAADDRRNSVARRPPVSYKPPVSSNASGVTASIPPIRSFRSSGERRRSLVLDMNARPMRGYEGSEDSGDSNHRDRTLRALEGRRFDDASQITPPDSAGDRPDGDDSGDLFLKIAREDTLRRNADNGNYGDSQSALSRVTRSSRRPLSVGVSSYQPSSPPQVVRRMSDQESSRSRGFSEDQSGERLARNLTYRGISRDKQTDEMRLKSTSTTPLRGSPLTPRSMVFQDGLSSDQGPASTRRRQGSIDNGTPLPSRMSSLKQGSVNYSHPRTYNSSPLVPKPADYQKHESQVDDTNHGVEGTNSTASTAAPSTVWDELDDLKSRIHRLELTGKLPPTSGAAISRASEERPPTAHTNATTLSASPKRGSGGAVQAPDMSNMSKDGHPVLHSALTKSRQFLSVEVYEALEAAANDALALSTMMGTAGQPGPISSGASSIGGGGSGATITDRQLRRKADSICRSLTELCLALSEGAAQIKPQQVPPTVPEDVTITSPTISKFPDTTTKFPGVSAQRRPSVPDRNLASMHSSPRALSRFEDRRINTIVTSALPAPRYSTTVPATPTDDMVPAAGRKTAMLISRSRRAGTEDPEEGRRSSLLRTRRATTEEPEDMSDRKPLLIRARRGTVNNDDEESRFRAPSRATTEVQGGRSGTREYASHLPAPPSKESESLASSALPRRRLGSSALNTRLVLPATSSNIATPQRRYFDRSTPDPEPYNFGDRVVEDRPQRQYSAISRAGSLDKRATRASMIATSSPAIGGYR